MKFIKMKIFVPVEKLKHKRLFPAFITSLWDIEEIVPVMYLWICIYNYWGIPVKLVYSLCGMQ